MLFKLPTLLKHVNWDCIKACKQVLLNFPFRKQGKQTDRLQIRWICQFKLASLGNGMWKIILSLFLMIDHLIWIEIQGYLELMNLMTSQTPAPSSVLFIFDLYVILSKLSHNNLDLIYLLSIKQVFFSMFRCNQSFFITPFMWKSNEWKHGAYSTYVSW